LQSKENGSWEHLKRKLDDKMRDVKKEQKIGCCEREHGNQFPKVKMENQVD